VPQAKEAWDQELKDVVFLYACRGRRAVNNVVCGPELEFPAYQGNTCPACIHSAELSQVCIGL
jgi:hypothetical protein